MMLTTIRMLAKFIEAKRYDDVNNVEKEAMRSDDYNRWCRRRKRCTKRFRKLRNKYSENYRNYLKATKQTLDFINTMQNRLYKT